MSKIERARMVALFATGAGLLAVACVYAQAAVWPVAGLLGVGAVVCADAALNVQEKARELHAAAIRAEILADQDDDNGRLVVHACPPDGSARMPCCAHTPFEVSGDERLTELGPAVTCTSPDEQP